MDEIEELLKFIIQLKEEKDQCFLEFNGDLPRMVKEARVKRQQMSASMGSPNNRKKPTNIGKGVDMTATRMRGSDSVVLEAETAASYGSGARC